MATEKQLEANRANALKSTGPRTEEGKAASSRNALRHGLAARGLIVLAGHEDAFAELESTLRDDLRPDGGLQEIIFKRALESAWNLERCRLAAAKLHEIGGAPDFDPLLDDRNDAAYNRIHRYTRENENSLYKAIRELGKLQAEDQYRHQVYPVTKEVCEDPILFAQTPQSLGAACSFEHVMKAVTTRLRNEAKTREIDFCTEIKAIAHLSPQEYTRRYEAVPEIARPAAA
jgi:hypothetical protein